MNLAHQKFPRQTLERKGFFLPLHRANVGGSAGVQLPRIAQLYTAYNHKCPHWFLPCGGICLSSLSLISILMAVVKWSGLLTSMVGKLNGSVFQGGPYGTIIRANTYGRRPQGKFAYAKRSDFFSVINFNRQLDLDERNAMNDYASTLFRPTKAGAETPYNWWSLLGHCNNNLKLIGRPLINSPFVVPSMPVIDPITVVPSSGDDFFKVNWTVDGGSDFLVVMSASSGIPDRTQFKKSRTRVVGMELSGAGGSFITGDKLKQYFGVAGYNQFHWWSFTVIHTTTGWSSPPILVLSEPE